MILDVVIGRTFVGSRRVRPRGRGQNLLRFSTKWRRSTRKKCQKIYEPTDHTARIVRAMITVGLCVLPFQTIKHVRTNRKGRDTCCGKTSVNRLKYLRCCLATKPVNIFRFSSHHVPGRYGKSAIGFCEVKPTQITVLW